MVHTLAVLTLKLAEAIGLYLVAVGVGLTLRPARFAGLIDDLERSPALTVVAGAAAFWIGAGILLAHPITADGLALIVTLFGLIAALKGLVILAFPGILAFYRPLTPHARVLGLVALVGGVILFLCGFTGRADALP